MATKRSISDVNSDDGAGLETNIHPSRAKKFKPNNQPRGASQPHGNTSKWRTKRIRDIKRQISRNQMPATVRHDLEQELMALQGQMGEKKVRKQRSEMIGRYHMVRFFERQKAHRRLKYFKRALETVEDAEEREKLQQDVHMSEVDIAYTQYYPHLEAYVSLWPKGKGDTEAEESKEDDTPVVKGSKTLLAPKAREREDPANKPEMWHVIETAMEVGTAASLEKIRDRETAVASSVRPPVAIPERKPAAAGSKEAPSKEWKKEKKHDKGAKTREKPRKNETVRAGRWQETAPDEEEDDGEGFFN